VPDDLCPGELAEVSASAAVAEYPPVLPGLAELAEVAVEAYHESFLQVKAFWKAMQSCPGSKRYTSPAVRHTALYALVHNNENPR
jgi:hypothetical protein